METMSVGLGKVKDKPTQSPVDKLIEGAYASIRELYDTHDHVIMHWKTDPEGPKKLRSLEMTVKNAVPIIGVDMPDEALKLWNEYLNFQEHLKSDLGFLLRKMYNSGELYRNA